MNLRALFLILVGGFAKSFIQSLLTVALAFMATLNGVGSGYLACFAGFGAAAQIGSSLVSGHVVDRLGWRCVLIVSAVVALVAVLLLVLLPGGVGWIAANSFKGCFFGVVAALLPVLLTAVVPAEDIGRASGSFQLSQQIGGVVGGLSGAAVAKFWGECPATALRIDFGLMAVPVMAFLLLMLTAGSFNMGRRRTSPQSPVRGSLTAVGPAAVFMIFMSACGVGTVMEYSVLLFVRRGLTAATGSSFAACASILALGSVILSTVLSRRIGALTRIAIGAVGMAVCFSCASFGWGPWFALAVCLAKAAFSFGPAACAWGLVPMLIEPRYRVRGTAIAIVAGQLVSLVLTSAFLPAMDRCGLNFCLVVFAVVSLMMAALTVVLKRKVCHL